MFNMIYYPNLCLTNFFHFVYISFFLNVTLDGDFLVIATDGLVQSSVHCYRVGLKANQGKNKILKFVYTFILWLAVNPVFTWK